MKLQEERKTTRRMEGLRNRRREARDRGEWKMDESGRLTVKWSDQPQCCILVNKIKNKTTTHNVTMI